MKQSGKKNRKKQCIRLLAALLCAAMMPVSVADSAEEKAFYQAGEPFFQTDFAGYRGGVPEGFQSDAPQLLSSAGQGVRIEAGAALKKTLDTELRGFIVLEAEVQAETGEKILFCFSDSNGNENKGIRLASDGSARVFCGSDVWQTEPLAANRKSGRFTLCIDSVRGTVSAGLDGEFSVREQPLQATVNGVRNLSFVNESGGALTLRSLSVGYGTNLEQGEIAQDSEDTIFVQIGSNQAYHRKNKIPLHVLNPDVRVFEENGEIYLPLKFLNECYEIPLIWHTDTDEAEFTAEKQIRIQAESKSLWKDGESVHFDHPAMIRDGVMYIPLPMAESAFDRKAVRGREGLIALDREPLSLDAMPERVSLILAEMKGSGLEEKFSKLDMSAAERVVAENILDSAWLSGDFGGKEKVPVTDMPFDSAWSIRTEKQPPGDYWNYKLAMPTIGDIKAGDICLISFYARGTYATDESGNAQLEVVLEQNANPWQKSLTTPFAAGEQWQRYFVPFQAKIDHPAGETELNLRLGYRPQTLELAALEAYNFGTEYKLVDMPTTVTTYTGREPDAAWRGTCIENIGQNRRYNTSVKVTDRAGNPVEGAQVRVEMQEHKVDFGTSVSQWYVTGQNVNATEQGRQDVRMYQDTLLKYFNMAVPENAYKWVLWEDGRKSNSRMCADWLYRSNIRLKGHALYWDSKDYSPTTIRDIAFTDPQRFDRLVREHIAEMASEFKDQIFVWDCLNEPSQSRNLMDSLGEDRIRGWFEAAKNAAPEADLYVNEMQILGDDNAQYRKFTKIVEGMVQNGVPFDGVGLQGHFGSVPAGPEAFLEQLKHFAAMGGGKKVALTEYDMTSSDEALQADFLRDLMIACYSLPEFQSFIMWGHWDSDHWRRNAPTFRADWSMKPAGQMWYRLIQYVWNTNVVGGTDETGSYSVSAYEGDYEITVIKDGREVQAHKRIDANGVIEIIL